MRLASSRRILFLLALLFFAQLGWWGLHIWRAAEELRQERINLLQARQAAAAAFLREAVAAGTDPEEAWQEGAADFPGIVLLPDGSGPRPQIQDEALARITRERDLRRWMVLGEGALFVVLLAWMLRAVSRSLQREELLALQQSNFVHAVTHELRSPLQSLRMAAETAERRPERAAELVPGILEDLTRLEGLVENVLAVGRLEAEAFQARPEPVDLSREVAEVLETVRASWPPEAPPLKAEIEEGLVAEADPGTLGPILRNLLDNARKYGGGQPVRLRLRARGSQVLLEVEDQGRGLAPGEEEQVFRRFWRAGDERVRTEPGTGLGLYLVKELCDAQGARIEARSDGPGRGTCFRISWPMSGSQPRGGA